MLSVSKALVLVSVIVFTLASFGVQAGPLSMVPLGLTLFAASFLVP